MYTSFHHLLGPSILNHDFRVERDGTGFRPRAILSPDHINQISHETHHRLVFLDWHGAFIGPSQLVSFFKR